jgi:pantoate--beta-alanine ligase
MEILRNPRIMYDTSMEAVLRGKTIGFVPTMGFLHEGHLSLVRRARQENDIVVTSCFVNPIQFGPSEDLQQYPRDIEGDAAKLLKEDVDILFLPDSSSMYPEGFSTYIDVEGISERLCGAFRPGHFKGVATIVAKLFQIVRPKRAYFGQKDFQQTAVVKRVAKDLDMDVTVIVCPTIRERDGLAMSSRNVYLGEKERAASGVIFKCLSGAEALVRSGTRETAVLNEFMGNILSEESAVTGIDYVGVYDPVTLSEVAEISGEVLLAVAVRIGSTRLIDNILVDSKGDRNFS